MKKEKIINFKKYEDFKKDLEAGELLETSIIFIDDLPGIYTHGTLFYCSSKPIIPGELAPDPEEPGEDLATVTFEFDEGIKDIDLYGSTIEKDKITFSGETVEVEKGDNITWLANLNDGYEYGENCTGTKLINDDTTVSITTQATQVTPTPTNNKIIYKTTNNSPATLSTRLSWGGNSVVSNEYDPETGNCVITLQEDLTKLPDDLFSENRYVSEIVSVPSTVKTIGDGVFSSCSALTTVNLSNLEEVAIGDDFCGASKITSIQLPEKITKVGGQFFYQGVIESINLYPFESVTTIGNNFLGFCSKIKELNLSGLKNVTSIGSGFCWGATVLKTFVIDCPDKVLSYLLSKVDGAIYPNEVYVNDELLSQYESEVTAARYQGKFKPLSEYEEGGMILG